MGSPVFSYPFLLPGYLLLGFSIFLVTKRLISSENQETLLVFNFFYFLFFVLYPINLLVLGIEATRQTFVFRRFGMGNWSTVIALIVCYWLFVFGYHVTKADFRKGGIRLLDTSIHKKIFFLAFVWLGLGSIGFTYQIFQLGGFLPALEKASCVRTSFCGLDGNFAFLRQLNPFFSTGFIIIWCAFCNQPSKTRRDLLIEATLLCLLTFAQAYLAALTNGRRDFVYPVIICFSVLYFARGNRAFKDHWCTIGFLIMISGSLLWCWLSRHGSTTVAQSGLLDASQSGISPSLIYKYLHHLYLHTMKGIGDSFMHFVAMQNCDLWQFGFLSDLRELGIQFLPTRLLGIDRERGMLGDMTKFILGFELSANSTGEEPPGLHGYLLMNFGYIGLFICFFILGSMTKKIGAALNPRSRIDLLSWIPIVLALVCFVELLREGLMVFVLKPRASFITTIFFYLFFLSKSRSSPHQPGLKH